MSLRNPRPLYRWEWPRVMYRHLAFDPTDIKTVVATTDASGNPEYWAQNWPGDWYFIYGRTPVRIVNAPTWLVAEVPAAPTEGER